MGEQKALYFVDSLAHRTLARCAACGLTLTGTGRAAAVEDAHRAEASTSCILGFRLESTRLTERSDTQWAHTTSDCLGRLRLPLVRPGCQDRDIVFSPTVSDSDRDSILRQLLQGGIRISTSVSPL